MIEGRDYAVASTIGARGRQEDDWGIDANPPTLEDDARLLAVVADGMGGMPAGNQASGIAIRTFLDSYAAIHRDAPARLRHALAHANREVGIAVEEDPALAGMGTTLVAALFVGGRSEWLSIGDSYILHWRDGELERVNPLHIYANELDELARRGEITADEAVNDPDRPALTSAIQGTVLGEIAQGGVELLAGDIVILASDGIATLDEGQIAGACRDHADARGAEGIANALIEEIDGLARPGQDNTTVAVVLYHGMDEEDTLAPHLCAADNPGNAGDDVPAPTTAKEPFEGSVATEVSLRAPTADRPAPRAATSSAPWSWVAAVAFAVGLAIGSGLVWWLATGP